MGGGGRGKGYQYEQGKREERVARRSMNNDDEVSG